MLTSTSSLQLLFVWPCTNNTWTSRSLPTYKFNFRKLQVWYLKYVFCSPCFSTLRKYTVYLDTKNTVLYKVDPTVPTAATRHWWYIIFFGPKLWWRIWFRVVTIPCPRQQILPESYFYVFASQAVHHLDPPLQKIVHVAATRRIKMCKLLSRISILP